MKKIGTFLSIVTVAAVGCTVQKPANETTSDPTAAVEQWRAKHEADYRKE